MLHTSSSTGRCPGKSPAPPAPSPFPAASRSLQYTLELCTGSWSLILVPGACPRHPSASLGSRTVYLPPGNARQPNPRVARSHPGHMPSISSRAPGPHPLMSRADATQAAQTAEAQAVPLWSAQVRHPLPHPEARRAAEVRCPWALKRHDKL